MSQNNKYISKKWRNNLSNLRELSNQNQAMGGCYGIAVYAHLFNNYFIYFAITIMSPLPS